MATTRNAAQGILADDNTEDREKIIELLDQGATGWRSRR